VPPNLIVQGFKSSRVQDIQIVQGSSIQREDSAVISWGTLFGLYQPAMGAVAVGVILRFPAAADGDGFWRVKFQNERLDIGDFMGAVAERWILRARTAAIGYALGYLSDDSRFNEVVIG
jgi:hypothetical protein